MGPSATPTTPTTGTPAPNSPASTESTFFVSLTISMPYIESAFTTVVRDKFKVAVARAAGTTSDKVQILTVTAGRRRAGGIKVETKILASDSTGVSTITQALGTGTAAMSKINTQLEMQGIEKATGVSEPMASTSKGKGSTNTGNTRPEQRGLAAAAMSPSASSAGFWVSSLLVALVTFLR